MGNEEKWVDIEGYSGIYQVSSHGRIRSLDKIVKCTHKSTRMVKGKIMSTPKNNAGRGYNTFNLCDKGKRKKVTVHRMVAEAFIPNPDNKPQVNHIDCDTVNNYVDNLEWCTDQENKDHAVLHGLVNTSHLGGKADKCYASKLTSKQVLAIKEKIALQIPLIEISHDYDVSVSTISELKSGRSWTSVGKDVSHIKCDRVEGKLSVDDVSIIKCYLKYSNITQVKLALIFGVSDGAIRQIKSNKRRVDTSCLPV